METAIKVSEQTRIDDTQQQTKEDHDPRKPAHPMHKRHDDLGQPFVGGPGQRGDKERKRVGLRDLRSAENKFPGANMNALAPIPPHELPFKTGNQDKKKDPKKHRERRQTKPGSRL